MYPYPIPILCKCSCSCSLYLVTVLTACCSEHCSEGPVPRHTLYCVHSSSSWHPVQLPTATFCGLKCKLGNLCSDNGYCSSHPCSGLQRELPAVLIMMFSLPPPSVRLSVISCSIAHIISATKTHCQPYIRLFLELYQSRQRCRAEHVRSQNIYPETRM